MTVEARIRVHHRGCVTERTHGGTTITQLSADGQSSIFLVTGETEEDVGGLLETLEEGIVGYTLLCQTPQVAMIRGGCAPSGVEESIRAYGCSVMWPALFMEGEEFYTLIAPSRERLKHLLERLEDFGSAHLLAVTDVGPADLQLTMNLSDLARVLTRRQLEVVTAARERGYYETPRRVTTEKLAESFGLSRSTLEEHLRKGEGKILTAVLDSLGGQPPILATVRSGGGRLPKPAAKPLHRS